LLIREHNLMQNVLCLLTLLHAVFHVPPFHSFLQLIEKKIM